MRRFFGAFALTLCAALTMSFASCSSGSSDSEEKDETPAVKNYTVTFDSDGGSEVASQTVECGKTATKPADPAKSGEKTSYAFLGWYNGDSAFDFASAITADVTLKAKWLVEVPGTTITGSESWTPASKVFVSGRSLTIGDLYVCDHEVTRGEFKSLMGTDPSMADAYDKDGNKLTGDDVLNNPVNYVNWYDAIVYCNKLSIKEGLTPCYTISGSTDPDNWGSVPTSRGSKWDAATCDFTANGYRLPTEAEWEWLARGGENYTYAGSDTVDDVAWYAVTTGSTGSSRTGSRDVKTKAANGYGLYDMSGNVWEWCWDWYEGYNRVRRGGAWYNGAFRCEVAYRYSYDPSERYNDVGFRLVRSAQHNLQNIRQEPFFI